LPVSREEVGLIRLADGSELKLRILVVDVREAGFSPFGGVGFECEGCWWGFHA